MVFGGGGGGGGPSYEQKGAAIPHWDPQNQQMQSKLPHLKLNIFLKFFGGILFSIPLSQDWRAEKEELVKSYPPDLPRGDWWGCGEVGELYLLQKRLLRPTSHKGDCWDLPPKEVIVHKNCWALPAKKEIVEKQGSLETYPGKDIVETYLQEGDCWGSTSYRGDCWEGAGKDIVETYLQQRRLVSQTSYRGDCWEEGCWDFS